MIKIKLI